jgi:soluble lytic murein transglycosylase-like protein
VTCFFWFLFAGAAMAQTAATPPNADKPAVATVPSAAKTVPATPPSADKATVATVPSAAKTAAPPPSADKAVPAPPPGADKTPAAAKAAEAFRSSIEKQRAAMAMQRESVRKQSEMAVQWLARPQEPIPEIEAPASDCDPIADLELAPLIDRAAKLHQLEPKLLRSVIEQESAFRSCAISAKGAKGLMQLMPATVEQFKVGDVFDPQQNIEAGATFLRQLLDKYKGDFKLALAAYNAGPTTIDKMGGIPEIKETQDYVEGILKKMQ